MGQVSSSGASSGGPRCCGPNAGLSGRAEMRLGLVLVLLIGSITASAGCTTTNEISGAPVNSGSLIVVDDGNGATVAVTTTKDTGALIGQVFSDAGFGLSEAHVALAGTDNASLTNASGWFKFEDLPPKSYGLRVDHAAYRAAEAMVEVKAGHVTRLNVTLVPREDVGAGYRPHIHDYWGGRTEVTVTDADFEFYPQKFPGPMGTYYQWNFRANQLRQPSCVSGAQKQTISPYTSTFHFDDSTQLIWPGTSRIEIRVAWTQNDYIGGDTVGALWRHPATQGWNWSDEVRAGQTVSIEVEPTMWDNAHQLFSLWEFRLCVAGQNTPGSTDGTEGRAFLGKYHVKMTIFRGELQSVDPPHPAFWKAGPQVRVMQAYRNVTCEQRVEICTSGATGRWNGPAAWQIIGKDLVPPGTGELKIRMEWTYGLATGNQPLGLAYSPANVSPYLKKEGWNYKVATADSKGANYRTYSLILEPGEADSFYQRFTNWVFLWGQEGKEIEAEYVHSCLCELRINLTVDAVKDPTVG